MCMILISYKIRQDFPLVIAANRDEFYERPTAPMHFWQDHQEILAGRDLKANGTWIGFTRSGRFAALTNYRDPGSLIADAPSRGDIIPRYLESKKSGESFLSHFSSEAERYNGFNLLVGDGESLFWFSNREKKIICLNPGTYGISNHLLNTPWPKVKQGTKALESVMSAQGPVNPEDLFSILKNQSVPEDALLPDTGVGITWERILAPIFIQSNSYGTLSSTLVIMDRQGTLNIIERSYHLDNVGNFDDRSFIIKNR